MPASSVLEEAFARLQAMYEQASTAIERIESDAVDERTRDVASRKLKHPRLSSTSLSDAKVAAVIATLKSESLALEAAREAVVMLIASQQARLNEESIDAAIIRANEEKKEKDSSGLYKQARTVVDRLYALGVSKWDYRQLSQQELEILADLLMWKAKDGQHSDVNTPWRAIFNIYEGRELAHKGRSLPLVSTKIPLLIGTPNYRIEAPSFIPTHAEMEDYLAENAQLAPPNLEEAYGGIVSMPSFDSSPGVLPMWSRQDRGQIGGIATMDDWYRFSVPRGPYVLIHNNNIRFRFNSADEQFPPYKRLSLLGVELELGSKDMDRLKAAEEGRGSVDIAVEVVRHFTEKLVKYDGLDEDLTRFWLFLLIGRYHPERVDRLFPHGYFEGVFGVDHAVSSGPGGFTIIRSTRTDDNGNALRRRCGSSQGWLRE